MRRKKHCLPVEGRGRFRRLLLETLEDRRLLNIDWRNPVDHLDADGDRTIAPLDVLAVINEINRGQLLQLPPVRPSDAPYIDIDGDGLLSPLDALRVINAINSGIRSPRLLHEQSDLVVEQSIWVTTGQNHGSRTLQVEITATWDPVASNSFLQDRLNIYVTNPDSMTTLLDRGRQGTSVFSLTKERAETVPGISTWDGRILSIDLTRLTTSNTAELRLQLLSQLAASGTQIAVLPISNQVDSQRSIESLAFAPDQPTPVGPAAETSSWSSVSEVEIITENWRYDAATQKLQLDARLFNRGPAIGRDTALVLNGLPSGMTGANASGTTSSGVPYWNLRTAIPRGGLGSQQRSDLFTIELENAPNTRFPIVPSIISGESNRAPNLVPIPPIDVMPGSTVEIALQASDPDGDSIQFSMVGGSQLPKLSLSTGGVLTIQPTPAQLGTYQLTVQASDGLLNVRETVLVRVLPDPVGTTRVSGRIVNVDGTPIAGLRIEVGAVSGLTAADGSFRLDLGAGVPASETLRVRGELLTGPLKYPFIAEKLPFMLQHEIYAGYNNVIVRPIYLPTLNEGSTVDSNTDVTVSRGLVPNEAPAEVLVRANTLFTQQGTPFTGALSITEVPPERTPAALPPGLRTDLVVTVQPGEMNFASPAPLRLPNRSNMPAGSPMDLWSINPVTGEFERVGGAVVSDDGQSVTTVSGGIRNSSWHFFSPEPDVHVDYGQNPRNQKDDRKPCPTARSGLTSACELSSGALVETHSLTSYQSMGIDRSLVWSYDSKRADPRPIVHVGYANVRPGSDRLLMATVDVERNGVQVSASGYERRPGDNYGLSGGENFWKVPVDGGNVNGALQVDLSSMPTGIYQVRIHQGLMSFANDRVVGSTTEDVERLVHVNGIGSPFGNGWGLAGLQQLFQESNGDVLIVDGDGADGDQLAYSRNQDGSYTSTPGDYSILTKLVGGVFQRREADGTTYEFEPSGLLTSIRDRIGNTTRYEYTTGTIRRLTAIVDPVGLRTNFSYSNERVSSVTDPANRTTRFDYDSKGNLIRITDPDGSFRTWDYDSGNRMVGETDKRGAKESATYHFSGRVIGATRKDGSRIEVQPLQLQGLYPPERTSSPINPPDAYRALTVESLYLDSNGNWTKTTLDDRGQELTSRDSVGRRPQTARDEQNQVTSTIDARGYVTHYRYDARGNLISQRDEISSSSRLIESVLSNPAEIDEYVFTAKPGQRLIVDGLESTNSRAQISISGDFALYSDQFHLSSNTSLDNLDYGVYIFPRGGELRIRISADLFSSGPLNYRFRLLDLSNAVPVETDSWIEGRNEFAGGTTLYQFQGVAGQELVGQWRGETSNAWMLFGPSLQDTFGNSFINGGQSSNITTTLPVTGTYWIFVRGSDANIPYSFRLVAPKVTQASLTLGSFRNPTLARFGDRAEYTFAGTIGQLLLINQANAALDIKQNLINPSGAPSTSWTLANPQLLRETGSYRYQVTSNVEDEIEAAFQILNLATSNPLPLGADTLATITRPLEATAYRFTAAAGDRLAVEDLSDVFGAFPAEFKLFDSQGQEVFTSRTGWDHTKTFTLAFAGEYYLVGKSTSADVAANIRFRASLATTTIFDTSLDSTLTGTLSRYADRHEYRFNASAGMNVQFDSSNTVFLTELVSPSGAILPSPSKVELLSESGVYRVRITRDARLGAATYSMRLLNADTLTAQPLNAVITVNASSDQPAILRWNATAGMNLKYEILGSSSGSGQWISPLGRENAGASMVVSAAGSYFLVIYSNQSQTESIQVRVTDISGGLTTSSGLNRRITGTLSGDSFIDVPIRSSAGVRVAMEDRTNGSGYSTSIELVDRDGNSINANISRSDRFSWIEIPNSSEIRIRIRNNFSSSYEYDYFIYDLTSAPSLSLGSYAEGTLASNESRIWRVALTAGRSITLDRDLSVMSPSLGISLFGHDASRIAYPLGQAVINFTGEYFLVSQPLSVSSTFAFRLLDSSSASSLNLNQDVNGSTNRPSQKLQYRFETTSAQLLSLDFLSQFTSGGTWSVRSMSGVTVASGGLQAARFSVTRPGSYLLTFELLDTTTSSLSFRLSPARTFARSHGFGATESVTFERMGDAFQYSLNLVAGDQVLLDTLIGFGVIATWTNANDATPSEFQTYFWNNEQLTTVLHTGTYTLTLRPSSMDVATNLTHSFQLLRGSQVTVVTTDTNNTVVLNPGSASQLYRFAGQAGQRISFSRLSSAPLSISLYSPFGSVQSSAWQDFEALLPITGTYVLAISGSSYNNEPIESAFRLSLGSEATTSIQWNQLISGSVAGVADRAYYLIPGTAGQRAMLLPETNNGHLYQLFAPSGRLLQSQPWSSAVLLDEFLETGSYRLVVQRSAAVGANPNFQFRLLDLPTSNPVPDGQEFALSFPTGKDAVIVPVSTPAPNGLEVRVIGTGTDLVSMSWFEPRKFEYSIGNAMGAQRIPNEGDQGWLLLRGKGTTSIQLRLVVASIVIEDKPMSVGNPLTGTLNQIAIEHRYRLPTTAYASYYFEKLPTTTSELTIKGANQPLTGDGVLYAEKPGAFDFLLAHTSGESSTATPSNYSLRVSRVTDLPITPVGSTLTAVVGQNSFSSLARMQVAAAQRVRLRQTSGPDAPVPILYMANGEVIAGPQGVFYLPAATNVWVVIRGNTVNPASVSFAVEAVGESPVTESGIDSQRSLVIPAGQQRTLEFIARVGTRVFLEIPQSIRNEVSYEVIDPSGNKPLTGESIFIEQSGTYQVTFRSFSSEINSSVVFRKESSLPTLALGSWFDLDINSSVRNQFLRVDIQPGGLYWMDIESTATFGSAFAQSWLENSRYATHLPDGSLVQIGASRTLTLQLEWSENQPATRIRLLSLESGATLAFDSLTVERIGPNQFDARIYKFEGQRGERIRFANTTEARFFPTHSYLISPTGEIITSSNAQRSWEATIPETGMYFIAIDGSIPSSEDYRFQLLRGTSTSSTLQVSSSGNAGNAASFTYDPKFSVMTSAIDELGRRTEYTIDPANGNVLNVIQVLGELDGGDDLITSYTYTALGLVDTATDPNGRVTDHEYDALGRLIRVTEAAGTASAVVTQFEYDLPGNLIAMIDPRGLKTEYQHDAANRVVQSQLPDPDGTGPETRPILQYQYDASGNQTKAIDPLGRATTWQYDSFDRPVVVTDTLGNTKRYRYDAASNVIQETDPLGRSTFFEYDSRNRMVAMTDAIGSVTRYRYDADGNLTETIDPRGALTTYRYDARGRMVEKVDPSGNQSVTRYNSVDEIVASIDPNGNTTEYQYDDVGRRIKAIGPGGEITSTQYDATGQILATTDPLGRKTQFEYDPLGRLTGIIDPLGNTTRRSYDAIGNMTESTSPRGGITRYEYDGLNRLIRQTDANGGVTVTAYDNAGNVHTIIDARGNALRFEYDAMDREIRRIHPLNGVQSRSYDNAGNLISKRDELGNETQYRYDSLYRMIATIDPLGKTYQTSFDTAGNRLSETDPLGRVIRYEFDASNRMIRSYDANDGLRSYLYDRNGNRIEEVDVLGRKTEMRYDTSNRLVLTVDASGAETRISYDPLGNITSITDDLDNTTRMTYDALNRVTESIDASGAITRFEYDSAGNLVRETDPLGNFTTNTYDLANRRISSTNALSKATTYEYDLNGNLTKVIGPSGSIFTTTYDALNRLVKITDPLGAFTEYQYDASGNQTVEIDALGRRRTMIYDPNSRLIKTTNPLGGISEFFYDAVGNVIRQIDENGRITRMAYDRLNRLTETTDPLGNKRKIEYDAASNVVALIDPLERRSSMEYDALNRKTSERDPRGGTTEFVYDSIGRIIDLTDPVGNRTTFTYDRMGRVVREKNAAGNEERTEYDAAGNPLRRMDREGRVRQFRYDQLQRMVGEDWLDAQGNTTRSIERTYDADSQLVSIADTQVRLDYSYDKNGRVLSEVATVAGPLGSTTIAYTYDAVGNLISRTDSRNGSALGKLVYQFDSLNRPTQIAQTFFSDQNASTRVAFGYDAAGQMLQIQRYDDSAIGRPVVQSNLTYDANGRLTKMIHSRGVDSLVQYDFTWDAANRMTSSSTNGSSTTYGYDATDQLVLADHASRNDESFSYDLNGNRTNSGYAHAINNQVTTDGKFEYTYDKNGNRIKRRDLSTQEIIEYVWDHRNRLTEARSINSSGNIVRSNSFAHDPMDRRIRKSVDIDGNGPAAQTDEWTTWADVHPAYRWNDAGSLQNRFLFGPLVDMVLAEHSTNQTRWTLADQLGSIRHLVDATGIVRNEVTYNSFGQIVGQTNASWQPSLGFAGSIYDSDLDLYQMRSRYYDPGIGRFVSEDPIAFSGGDTNLVRYANNQPISQKDPYGTDVWVAEHTIPAVNGIGNYYHRAIILAPNNPRDFANEPLFKQTHYSDLSGKPMLDSKRDPALVGKVATLGGEPNGKHFNKNPIFGNLIGVDNFSGDAPDQLVHWTLVKTPKGKTDTEFIRGLIDAAHRYKNNKEYWPTPVHGDESYNSNSYVSGLLISEGAEPPVVQADVQWGTHVTFRAPTIAPGYDKPLPIPPKTPTPRPPSRPTGPRPTPQAPPKPIPAKPAQSPSSRAGNVAGKHLGDLGASEACSPSKPQPKKPTSPSKPPSRPNAPNRNPSPTHKPTDSTPTNHSSSNGSPNPLAVDAVMATMGGNGNGVTTTSPQAPVYGPAWGITRSVTHKLPKEVGDKILAELSRRFGTKITSYSSKVEYDPGFGNSSKMAFKGTAKFTRPATPEEMVMADRIRRIADEMRNPETRQKRMEEFADRLRNIYGIPWKERCPIGGCGFRGDGPGGFA